MRRHVTSIAKLASELGLDYEDLRKNYQPLDDFPAKTASGWPVLKCLNFINARKEVEGKTVRGANADLHCVRLELQCDILRDKRDEFRGDLVHKSKVRDTIAEMCSAFRHSLENRVQFVASTATSSETVQEAEDLRDKTMAWAGGYITDAT